MPGRTVPDELITSLINVDGFDVASFVDAHEHPKQVVSVRFNPAKLQTSATDLFPEAQKVPWSTYGYYLPVRPQFIFDPLLHAGVYYVQEASGMFIEQCLKQTTDISQPLTLVDLCAAPGGKSTLLQSLINEKSILVSNEVIKSRASVLVENMTRWGGANVIVTNNDPRDFARLDNFFDVMVVDAPCSGSGLFRRDSAAINEWSTDAVTTCSLRQQRILDDAYPSLKKGGVLIYSTCSYSPEENEQICDWLIDHHQLESVRINVQPDWNIVETTSEVHRAFGYRFFPDKLKGEGFFVTCFRKIDGSQASLQKTKRPKVSPVSNNEKGLLLPWIKNGAELFFFHNHDEINALPAACEAHLFAIQSHLYIKKAGIAIGKPVRNELLPTHDLAMALIKNDQLPIVSLKKDEALQYLRKEEVTIHDAMRGWALAAYEGYCLGWLKLLGNRANNYYPKEWRILKSGTAE